MFYRHLFLGIQDIYYFSFFFKFEISKKPKSIIFIPLRLFRHMYFWSIIIFPVNLFSSIFATVVFPYSRSIVLTVPIIFYFISLEISFHHLIFLQILYFSLNVFTSRKFSVFFTNEDSSYFYRNQYHFSVMYFTHSN